MITGYPRLPLCLLSVSLCFTAGCGNSGDSASSANGSASSAPDEPTATASVPEQTPSAESGDAEATGGLPTIQLGSLGGSNENGSAGAATGTGTTAGLSRDEIMSVLKPLQVLLGNWRGTTRREFEGFKMVDAHEWVWDLQTIPESPALAIASDKSPYLSKARLTVSGTKEAPVFLLQVYEDGNSEFTFEGELTEPVRDVAGDKGELQRTFRLQFTQKTPDADGDLYRFTIAQQENNRYLLEVDKKRGSRFVRFDTVSTQREGTSFALSDSDYGDKTCIISEGLGTISVSYQGKSYWVCCTGCKAAFEEDPEAWIARAEEKTAAQKN